MSLPSNSMHRSAEARTQPLGYRSSFRVRAPPERVFDAVSTREGVVAWWAQKAHGSFASGGTFALDFRTDHMKFRVDEAVPPTRVVWTCLERQKGEWPGTRVIFNIQPDGANASRIDFLHEGLTEKLECFDACVAGWDMVLPSLRSYLEEGRGKPWETGRKASA